MVKEYAHLRLFHEWPKARAQRIRDLRLQLSTKLAKKRGEGCGIMDLAAWMQKKMRKIGCESGSKEAGEQLAEAFNPLLYQHMACAVSAALPNGLSLEGEPCDAVLETGLCCMRQGGFYDLDPKTAARAACLSHCTEQTVRADERLGKSRPVVKLDLRLYCARKPWDNWAGFLDKRHQQQGRGGQQVEKDLRCGCDGDPGDEDEQEVTCEMYLLRVEFTRLVLNINFGALMLVSSSVRKAMCTYASRQRTNDLQLKQCYRREGPLDSPDLRILPCIYYSYFFMKRSDSLQFIASYVCMMTGSWPAPDLCASLLPKVIAQTLMRKWANPSRSKWKVTPEHKADYEQAHQQAAMAWPRKHRERAATGYRLQLQLRQQRLDLLSNEQYVLPDLISVQCTFTSTKRGKYSISKGHVVLDDGQVVHVLQFGMSAGLGRVDGVSFYVDVLTQEHGWPSMEPSLQLSWFLFYLKFLDTPRMPSNLAARLRRSQEQLDAGQQLIEHTFPACTDLHPLASTMWHSAEAPAIQAAATKAEAQADVVQSRLAHAAALSNEQWQVPEYLPVYSRQTKGPFKYQEHPGKFHIAQQHILVESTGAKVTPQDFLKGTDATAQGIKLWSTALYILPAGKGDAVGGMKLIGASQNAQVNAPSASKRSLAEACHDAPVRRRGKAHRTEDATQKAQAAALKHQQAGVDAVAKREERRQLLCTDEHQLPDRILVYTTAERPDPSEMAWFHLTREVIQTAEGEELEPKNFVLRRGRGRAESYVNQWAIRILKVAGDEFGIGPMFIYHFMHTLGFWSFRSKQPSEGEAKAIRQLRQRFPACADLPVLDHPKEAKPKQKTDREPRKVQQQQNWDAKIEGRREHLRLLSGGEALPETIIVRPRSSNPAEVTLNFIYQCIISPDSGAPIKPGDYVDSVPGARSGGWTRRLFVAPDQGLPECSVHTFLAAMRFIEDKSVRAKEPAQRQCVSSLELRFPALRDMDRLEIQALPALKASDLQAQTEAATAGKWQWGTKPVRGVKPAGKAKPRPAQKKRKLEEEHISEEDISEKDICMPSEEDEEEEEELSPGETTDEDLPAPWEGDDKEEPSSDEITDEDEVVALETA
ncbi:hypothetical protein WJX73_004265 [Symbiochloris irregularis]|uniref:Uncharacterized protein n=1 Tax=Symbiochloris irregularis TaxID=706552 RepID=A0AAW1NZT5_9CHLO